MTDEPQFHPENLVNKKQPKKNMGKFLVILLVLNVLFVLGLVYAAYSLNQPTSFSEPISVTMSPGEIIPVFAHELETAGVVRSGLFLQMILSTQFDTTKIKASEYVFTEPLSSYEVAERLMAGDFDTDLTSVTVIEGESISKIADRLNGSIDWFDRERFIIDTIGLEGKLFPDTYFVPADFDTSDFVLLLHDTYHEVIDEYITAISESTFTENEVIILASIVEREANTNESMKLVAGIFQNRLAIGMALQADASIEYVLDEGLHELDPGELAENLRELDSPYNTYLYAGLPPTPIGNPGRAAIEAVLFPTESDYLYYITGNDGEFYYAETYNQHLVNIERHLR